MNPDFTPLSAALGGTLIGLSAAAMLAFNGRIAGISGTLGGLVAPGGTSEERRWRGAFVVGMVAGGVVLRVLAPQTLPGPAVSSLPLVVLAGLLVGFGTRTGGGCTSGHGVCGISRFSTRSLVATALFMGTAMLTTGVARHLLGVGS